MHVVIVGAGEVGTSIAKSLSDGHDVVVIERDGDRVDDLTYSLDVLAIQGDGTDVEMLREADVDGADLFIACTDSDETNIVTCGVADTIGDQFTVARVKRRRYLEAWHGDQGALGVDFMVCTDLLTATSIVDVIGLATAQDVDSFADGLVQMTEFKIPPESPVVGQTVAEADRFDTLTFAGVFRDETETIIPRGDTVIEADDEVVVIGSPEHIRQFSAEIAPEQEAASDVVIVGGSEIGTQTARLLSKRGYAPRLVEHDPVRARDLAERLPDTTVLENDATNRAFLERENVGRADAVIAALENDQQNLLACLLAKRLGTERTIAVVDTAGFADLFEAVGVDVAVSPRAATAEEITRFTRARRAENVAILEGDEAEVLELQVTADGEFEGRTVRDVAEDLPDHAVIGAIARDGELVRPRGETVIAAGDHLIVFGGPTALNRVAEQV